MAIQSPNRGQPLRASWAAEITSAVNDLALMSPEGMLTRSGPSGCGFSPVPSNRRQSVASTLHPFLVRHVAQSLADPTIPYTGYEIYLPTGCVSVGSTCAPLNPPAYRTVDGSTVNQPGWYRLPAPSDPPSDGDVWSVEIHAKCSAARTGIDTFQEWPKRYLWAEAHGEMTQAERESNVADVGDSFAATVGSIRFTEEEGGDVTSTYNHGVKTPIMVRETASSEPMALFFAFTVNNSNVTLSLDKLFVKNLTFSAAGATFISEIMHEIETTDEAVYLKIVTTTTPYTASIVSFQAITAGNNAMTVPQQVQSARQPGEIWVMLYALKNGHVTTDNLKTLSNIQIYQ